MKKFWIIVCIVLLLVALDQGAKLIINSLFEAGDEALMQVRNTLHIHHMINYQSPETWAERAGSTGMSVTFWKWADVLNKALVTFALICAFYFIRKLSEFAGIKSRKSLVNTIIIFICSSAICALIDNIIWEGTHDFICISRTYTDESGKLKIGHASYDIKDWYLHILLVLVIVYMILWMVEWIKFEKNKEAYAGFKEKLKGKGKLRKILGKEQAHEDT